MTECLREYRCKKCGKLLCKGALKDTNSVLEVKCRGCGALWMFRGPDRETIKKRSVLIREGLIPDPEVD